MQLGRRGDEPLAGEGVQIVFDRIGRVLQAGADLLHGGADEAWCEAHLIAEEVVGMLRLYAEGGQGGLGEVLEILGDDHVAAARDGGGEDMAVIGVGQGEGGDQRFIAGDKRVAGMAVHEVPGALERGAVAVRLPAQERLDPLPVDVGAPSGLEEVGYGELQKQVSHGSGIEDIGVEQGRKVAQGRP